MAENRVTMEKLVNLCKNRGFIFQGSEIYGGLANTWDYGPLGVELKNNIKKEWWKAFVQTNDNSFGVDAAILMNPTVWSASGHVDSFSDPKMDCKVCKTRHRADTLIEEYAAKKSIEIDVDEMTKEEMEEYINKNNIKCPKCGGKDYTEIKNFNLMFSTNRSVTDAATNLIYLRPETAQGEFVNFLNVQRSMRAKVPFGIAQIGKAFRNEITPGNFTFRTVEFEQMEHQLFCKEGQDEAFYEEYKDKAMKFYESLGFAPEVLRFKDHDKLAHYAKAACDVQFYFPFGWGELSGIHNRTNYDLSRHQEFSGKNMMYMDPITNEKYIPYVVEYSVGADRLNLAVMSNAYKEEVMNDGDVRVVLALPFKLAPYKCAILPLQKNLGEKAMEIYRELKKEFMVDYDDAGSIGKRYRRHDEVGTPYCMTIDFDTLEDGTVTVRDRDTMLQSRIKIEDLKYFLMSKGE